MIAVLVAAETRANGFYKKWSHKENRLEFGLELRDDILDDNVTIVIE